LLRAKILGYLTLIVRSLNLITVLYLYSIIENSYDVYLLANIFLIAAAVGPTVFNVTNISLKGGVVQNRSSILLTSATLVILLLSFYSIYEWNVINQYSLLFYVMCISFAICFIFGLCAEHFSNASGHHKKVLIGNLLRNCSNILLLSTYSFASEKSMEGLLVILTLSEILKVVFIGVEVKSVRINWQYMTYFIMLFVTLAPLQVNALVDRAFVVGLENGEMILPMLYAERVSFAVFTALYAGLIIHIQADLANVEAGRRVQYVLRIARGSIDKVHILIGFIVFIVCVLTFFMDFFILFYSSLMFAFFFILMPIRFVVGVFSRLLIEHGLKKYLLIALFTSIGLNFAFNFVGAMYFGAIGVVLSTCLLDVLFYLVFSRKVKQIA